MKKTRWGGLFLVLLPLLGSGCDQQGGGSGANLGNVSVVGTEGRIVGDGRMYVDGHKIEVKYNRVWVDGKDYGQTSDGSEIYFSSKGDYTQVLVNGEERHGITH